MKEAVQCDNASSLLQELAKTVK